MAKGKEYLDALHKFEMRYGDAKSGVFQVMTGGEAKAINEAFRIAFIKEVEDAYPNPHGTRLRKWFLTEKFTSETATDTEAK